MSLINFILNIISLSYKELAYQNIKSYLSRKENILLFAWG